MSIRQLFEPTASSCTCLFAAGNTRARKRYKPRLQFDQDAIIRHLGKPNRPGPNRSHGTRPACREKLPA